MPNKSAVEERSFFTCDVTGPVDNNRVLTFMMTTPIKDRMGDEIPLEGWEFDNFIATGAPVLWAHGYGDHQVGRGLKIYKGKVNGKKGWKLDVEFVPLSVDHPIAHRTFDMARLGFIKCGSVGFRAIDSERLPESTEDNEERQKNRRDEYLGRKFLRKELLEYSLCPVPANPEALQDAMKKGLLVPDEMAYVLEAWRMTNDLSRITRSNVPEAVHGYFQGNNQAFGDGNSGMWIPMEFWDARGGWEFQEGYSEIRYRVKDPSLFDQGSLRRVAIQKKKPRVFSVMGKKKGQDAMSVQSLRFPVADKWDLASAKSWLSSHKDLAKSVEEVLGEWDQDTFDLLDEEVDGLMERILAESEEPIEVDVEDAPAPNAQASSTGKDAEPAPQGDAQPAGEASGATAETEPPKTETGIGLTQPEGITVY